MIREKMIDYSPRLSFFMEHYIPTSREEFINRANEEIRQTHDVALAIINPEVAHIYDFMRQLSEKWNMLIGHQTSAEIAEKILQNHEYFSETGLNGTSLMMNPEYIARTSIQQSLWKSENGITIHRWSDALLIVALDRQDFPGVRNLDTIDNGLLDFVEKGYLTQYGVPPQCVYGYITQNTLHLNQAWTGKIKHETEYHS